MLQAFAYTQSVLHILRANSRGRWTSRMDAHLLPQLRHLAVYVHDCDAGAEVAAAGMPEDVARCAVSQTGRFLRKLL